MRKRKLLRCSDEGAKASARRFLLQRTVSPPASGLCGSSEGQLRVTPTAGRGNVQDQRRPKGVRCIAWLGASVSKGQFLLQELILDHLSH